MGASYGTSDAGILRLFDDIYSATGWSDSRAAIAVAIAGRESGGNPNALGDMGIQDLESDRTIGMRSSGAYWGPSVGLFQIRTIHSGKGNTTAPSLWPDRNYLTLMPSPGDGNAIAQILAMQRISGNGASWGAWANGTTVKNWYDGTNYSHVVDVINADRGKSLDKGAISIGGPDNLGGSIGAVAGIPGDIASGAKAVLAPFTSVAEFLSRVGAWLIDPHNLWRILEVALGGAIILTVTATTIKGV